jgi:hypothetical protein
VNFDPSAKIEFGHERACAAHAASTSWFALSQTASVVQTALVMA